MNEKKKKISNRRKNSFSEWILSINTKKLGTTAAILIFSFVCFAHLVAAAYESRAVDFYAFYTGASLLVNDRDNLYNYPIQYETQRKLFPLELKYEQGFMAYVNLPLSATLFIPLLYIRTDLAETAAHTFSLFMILLAIYRLYRFHKIRFLSWTTVFISSCYTLYASVHLGQIGTFLFWVITEMYIAFMERKTTRLAIFSSLLLLKFQYLPLIPLVFAMYKDKRRYITITSLGILLLFTINLFLMRGDVLPQYIFLIKDYIARPENFGMKYIFGLDIYSLMSIIAGGFMNPHTSMLFIGFFILICESLLFFFLLNKHNTYKQGSDMFYFCVIFSLIMTPHTMAADFVFLLLPLIGLLPRIRKPWFYIATVMAFSLFFYVSAFGNQWLHSMLLLLYLPLLFFLALSKPGGFGRKIQTAVVEDNPENS